MAKSGGKVNRGAGTGRFATERKAAANLKTTVSETRGGGSTKGSHRSAITGKFGGPAAAAPWPDRSKSATTPARDGKSGRFIVGAKGMEKLNAVEGVRLSRESREMFSSFESLDLTPEQRRKAIIAKHARKS